MAILKKYITCYEPLNNGLKDMGFRPNGKYRFLREYNQCIQELDFGHANYGPVKYFGFTICVGYPEVQKLGKELEAFSVGIIGTNIGYVTPKKSYKDWRIDASSPDVEETIQKAAKEMLEDIECYALPFMNRLSSIKVLISEIEKGNHLVTMESDYQLPILYYLNGEKDLALSYLKNELKRKESVSQRNYSDFPFADVITEKPSSSVDRFLKAYQDFAERFIEKIKAH
ncbi:MAG: hypothetical protein IKN19_09175 [Bacteroidaceae bacterium]|nr:hypothetical protein [Bacteroidaceae bacterium]